MKLVGTSDVPVAVDRMIIHQFDPAKASPGGIDTCIRGLLRYAPRNTSIAVLGVDAGDEGDARRIGRWEQYEVDGYLFWFMPLVGLDPAQQSRRIPHSIRLVCGMLRNIRKLPRSRSVQCHRMDTGLVSLLMFRRELIYFVHTQEAGLTGKTSDSFWRYASRVHSYLESRVVDSAIQVVVFNPQYAETLGSRNSRTFFSPTWFDPVLVRDTDIRADYHVVWVGRLEVPKDPVLAISTFADLVKTSPKEPWRLHIVGSGTLSGLVASTVAEQTEEVRSRIDLHGRVDPVGVAELLGASSVFLMTSQAGYEGFPRVLVEALASGLPCVVTEGCDTGSLITDSLNGFVGSRDPKQLSSLIKEAAMLRRCDASSSVSTLSAPAVVDRIFRGAEMDGSRT